jgi:hypothetical protein
MIKKFMGCVYYVPVKLHKFQTCYLFKSETKARLGESSSLLIQQYTE